MAKKASYLMPIKSKSVVQQVIDRITEAIADRRIQPGDKILAEQELADSFGVSRNSVREAIKILVSYGILEIRRPEGTFVCQGFTESMINPLVYEIILADAESMESLKELREWIDIGLIYKAAQNADDEGLEKLSQALEEIKKAVENQDSEAVFEADDMFHQCMAEITHNILFAKISDVTRLLTKKIRYQTVRNMAKIGKIQDMYDVHHTMYQIIKKRECNSVEDIVRQGYFYEYGVLNEEQDEVK